LSSRSLARAYIEHATELVALLPVTDIDKLELLHFIDVYAKLGGEKSGGMRRKIIKAVPGSGSAAAWDLGRESTQLSSLEDIVLDSTPAEAKDADAIYGHEAFALLIAEVSNCLLCGTSSVL
jgi:hypothetical protein